MNVNRLSDLRKQKNWSLQDVADQLGIAKSTYAGYESGYRRPSLEALKSIADLFGTSVDYLIGRTKAPTPEVELNTRNETAIYLDGQALSEEELLQVIAFVRTKRQLELESIPK